MKINFFKKENTFKKKDFAFHPNFYWRIIVFGAAIIIILSFLFGYRLFTQINEEPVLSSVNEGGVAGVINQDRISKALNYFSEKENKLNKILNFPASIVDPSL